MCAMIIKFKRPAAIFCGIILMVFGLLFLLYAVFGMNGDEEIRAKKYYVPELELIMVDGIDDVIGYAMFSRFHIEGRYEDELLILTPVAVKTELQRQHISRDLIEYGFAKARKLGFTAVLVEGNPKNYNPRGFQTSADFGIVASSKIHLPHVSCLMVKELAEGALAHMSGTVDYSFYESLR